MKRVRGVPSQKSSEGRVRGRTSERNNERGGGEREQVIERDITSVRERQ